MGKTVPPPDDRRPASPREGEEPGHRDLPLPTSQFRRRAWISFQRALDPLAPPRPLRVPRQH